MIRAVVRVLEVDPALAEDLDTQSRMLATERAVARVETLEPGVWRSNLIGEAGHLDIGMLVLEGVLGKRIDLDGRPAFFELIGEGDLIRPRMQTSELGAPFCERWLVLKRATIALLDHRFALTVARWPQISSQLIARVVRQSRSIAFSAAVSNLTCIELRLLIALWHVADRWGRVTPNGVAIPMKLTNDMLAGIIGARRPSVSTAMNVMVRRNTLSRGREGSWILHGDPPEQLSSVLLAIA